MVHLWALLGVTETEIICCKDYEKVVFKMEEEGVSCKTERQGLSISALLGNSNIFNFKETFANMTFFLLHV